MKRKRLSALILTAPLLALCACGGTPELSFTPNWYANTLTDSITGTDEILEYNVTFRPREGDLSVSYETGTYTTTLKDANYTAADGRVEHVYLYTTSFRIRGRYTYLGQSGEQFEDSMESSVWFLPASSGLRPLESVKTVRATVPASSPVAGAFTTAFDYSYRVVYDEALTTAHFTLDVAAPQNGAGKRETDVDIRGNGTFLDNEEIAFALRGMDLTATALFASVDPQTRTRAQIAVSQVPTKGSGVYSFELNGEKIDKATIETYEVPLSYRTSQPGPIRHFVYAAVTDPSNNVYRSALLQFDTEIMQNLGVMTYTLSRATFNQK